MMNLLFEVGNDPSAWTLLPADLVTGQRSERHVPVPLDPPLTVDGHVVTARATPDVCVRSYVDAFAD
jgi:hypothetical protein